MNARAKTWLKWLAIAFALLVVLFASTAYWLLRTESGTRFALERAKGALAGKLLVAQAKGMLVSPLELTDVEYRDPASGIDVKVKSLRIEYAFSGLLHRVVHVEHASIDGVEVVLSTVPPASPAAPAPTLQQVLTPPLDVFVDDLHVGTTHVSQDGQPVFASDSLDAAATWTSQALALRKLALRAPDGKLDASATIDDYASLRGSARAAVDWRLPAKEGEHAQRLTATLDASGDGKQSNIVLATTAPLAATVKGTVSPTQKTLPWQLHFDVPAFDPSTLSPGASVKSLALQLTGSGDRESGSVTGSLDADGHRVLLDPFTFRSDAKTFTVEALTLRSPEAPGLLHAQATVQLDAQPVTAQAKVDWEGVVLPADLVGQALATHGHLDASGSAQAFAANGALALGPPNQLADIALKLTGTPDKITLQQFDINEPGAKTRGVLHATGDVLLKPRVGWNLTAHGERLDPGVFAKGWPGAIDFALSTQGTLEKDGPAGKLKLDHLAGTLRQRPLSGDADLTFAPPAKVDGKLDVASGQSHVSLTGKGGTQTDVRIDLAIASLGDWLPQSSGSLNGQLTAKGAWPKLDVAGRISGAKVVNGDTHLDALQVDLDVHDVSAPNGSARVDARGVSAGGLAFDTLRLDAKGAQAQHHVEFSAHGKPLSLDLALDGALAPRKAGGSDWRAQLSTLTLTVPDQPVWKLTQPAALAFVADGFSVDNACLRGDQASLCASASQDAKGASQARFTLEHLPLAMLVRIASPDAPVHIDGEINGNGNLTRSVDGALDGHAAITSDSGTITYADTGKQTLLSYKAFRVDAALSPQQHAITIGGDLNDGGRVDGHIIVGAGSGALPLSGNVSAHLNNLAFVDLLTPSLSGTKGKVEAAFTLGGTSVQPALDGSLTLSEFATEVPAAGLKLHDGKIGVHSRDGATFDIDGSIASAEGKLTLQGTAGTAANAPLNLSVKGEDFLAADIPGARLHISPDLKIQRDAKLLSITGTVQVPQMYVDLSKLPGAGGPTARSGDVVLVDDPPQQANATVAALPALVDVTVKLGAGEKLAMDLRQGTEVHLIGYGLNADLGGQLAVHQGPGEAPVGRGQVQLNGTFKAYGQDLTIEQGRLLFAGTPVENPGLDIRATRGFPDDNITVGLQVRGTALRPELTVFSTPAMEQSDALSYLVAGKPLSQLKGGEGSMVGSAASALGTAGGDLLAKSIGAKMGLDDVGVADNTAVGGAALTVGKYLSPRLYLGYGVGLFTPGQVVTLRYKLTRLFDFEMQNGSLSSRAGINYRIEK